MSLIQKLEEAATAIYLHADAARGVSPLDVLARPVQTPVMIGGFEG